MGYVYSVKVFLHELSYHFSHVSFVIRIFDIGESKVINQTAEHQSRVTDVDFSSDDGQLLVTCSADSCVHVFNKEYEPCIIITDHHSAVTSAKFVHLNDQVHTTIEIEM